MSEPVQRARAHFSVIQITLVSIVVALALQLWLDRLPEIDAMWEPTSIAARIWFQALTAVVIIVKMWTGFTLSAIVVERVPHPVDLLGPMGVLIFVDAQIMNISAENAVRWWYVLGVGSLVAALYLHLEARITSRDRRGRNPSAEATSAARPVRPDLVECSVGLLALGIGASQQLLAFGESTLLVLCAAFLAIELATLAGPLLAWRALRRSEATG